MIDHKRRLIFVHIQKTGGNAISNALGQNPNCPEKHFLATELRDLYGQRCWDEYFKFSFVRNPWDRLVSWWSMINGSRLAYQKGEQRNKFQTFVLKQANSFEEFLEHCDKEITDSDGRKWIYRNQLDYLTDSNGVLMVDFIGRFEVLQQDFDTIMNQSGNRIDKLDHLNRSSHAQYSTFYSPDMAKKVELKFARDIQKFGYRFGS